MTGKEPTFKQIGDRKICIHYSNKSIEFYGYTPDDEDVVMAIPIEDWEETRNYIDTNIEEQ